MNIAYQVVGDGPRDLVYVPGWVSNVEVMWEDPRLAAVLERLASFSRLILFDKRGTGMSDAVAPGRLPGLEERMDDVRAVMDAVGSERATLFGHSEGGNMCILFAATWPQRVDSLILLSSYAKRIRSDEYPWAPAPTDRLAEIEETEAHWADPDHIPSWMAPSRESDPSFREWLARYLRLGASPKAATELLRMNTEIDTTEVLSAIQAPTLLLYRERDTDVLVEEGRWIAERIPGAHLVELPGQDHWLAGDDQDEIVTEIQRFVTGTAAVPPTNRVLATVVFTDIVGSTELVESMGDERWARLLDQHHRLLRSTFDRHAGTEVVSTGDGFLATFDGPARAIRAAMAIVADVRTLGLEVRAGIHTGEVELTRDNIAGVGVHIGARIAALARAGEVTVSRTVKDLVAGSGIRFEDRGLQHLKGIDEPWQVYRVAPTGR